MGDHAANAAELKELNASLERTLARLTVERDAAVVAKEDLATQLRLMKRRLSETEEEQYRAEEDTAALRAELERMQHMQEHSSSHPSPSLQLSDQVLLAERERDSAKAELQDVIQQLQSEQQKLAAERRRTAILAEEAKDLETALVKARESLREAAKQAEAVAESSRQEEQAAPQTDPSTTIAALEAEIEKLKQEKQKHEGQLLELASMVERQEKGRQKLLSEIDSQSTEIEKLFVDNEGLTAAIRETNEIAARWESQVRECLRQNADLRSEIAALREERLHVDDDTVSTASAPNGTLDSQLTDASTLEGQVQTLREDRARIRAELAKALARGDSLAAECAQLSADYTRSMQALSTLGRLYKPVLANIEKRLLLSKHESSVSLH